MGQMDTACGHSLHGPGSFRKGSPMESGASGKPAILVDAFAGLGHGSSGKVDHDDCAMPQHCGDGGDVDFKSSTHVAGFDCLGSGWMEVKKKGKSFGKLLATKSAGGQNLPVECVYGQRRGDVLDAAEPTSGAVDGGTTITAPDPQRVMHGLKNCNRRLTTSLGNEHSFFGQNCPCGTDTSRNLTNSSEQLAIKSAPRFRWGDLDEDELTMDHKEKTRLGSCSLGAGIVLVETSLSGNSVKYEQVDQLKDEECGGFADSHHEPEVLNNGDCKFADTYSSSSLMVRKPGDHSGPQGTKTVREDSGDSGPLHSSAGCVVYPDLKVDSKKPADAVKVDMSNPMDLLNTDEQQALGENKERFQSRLWCFPFENLNRAIDELYFLCELECDSVQMDEVLLVLTEAGLDFKELKARAEAFEKVRKESGVTGNLASVGGLGMCKGENQRPHAIAWEVRRIASSPRRAEILLSSLEAFKRAQLDRVGSNDIDRNIIKGAKSSLVSNSDRPPSKPVGMSQAIRAVARRQLAPSAATGPETTFTDIRELKGPCLGEFIVSQESSVRGESWLNNLSAPQNFDKKDQGSPGNTTVQCLANDSGDKDSNETGAQSFEGEDVFGSIGSINALEAWKVKRNWEDILTSPLRGSSCPSRPPITGKHSLERVRILHDKLMSPEKRKKSPLEMKKQVDEKQARATKLRMGLESERVQRLQRTTEKLNRVSEWQAVRSSRLREGMHARQQRGESRHEAHLAQIARRASAESSKVSEVRFITSLNEENRKLSLQQKLQDSEVRRAERLQSIRIKQKEDVAKEEAALERRKRLEAERLQRIADAQRKKDEATARREEERKAASAAREARAIEQVRKKEVRAKAQQEEAILLGQKLAEKLRESSARRKFYLEQIRERGGTESDKNEKRRDCQFDSPSRKCKDQGSVLLRSSSSGDRLARGICHYTDNMMTLDKEGILGKGLGNKVAHSVVAGDPERNGTSQQTMKKRVKKVRQRLAARKFEYTEPSSGIVIAELGSSVNNAALSQMGRWLQDLQRHPQPRKSGSSATLSIVEDIVKYLEGKEAELNAARQSALLDYVATALPASHSSKVETSKCTIALLHLLIVLLTIPANRSYFIARNLSPPLVSMLSTVLESFCNLGSSSVSTTFSGNSLSGPNDASVERSMMDERLEITGEIFEGLLLALIAIMDHPCKEERLLLMQDDLVELILGCEVIHRLCNLFALFDRPQVEGAPISTAVLLGLKLLETLTGHRDRSSTSVTDNAISFNFLEKVSEMRDPMMHPAAGRRWTISGEVTPFNTNTDSNSQGSTSSQADESISAAAGSLFGDDVQPVQVEGRVNHTSRSAVGALGTFKEVKVSKTEALSRPDAEDNYPSEDPAIHKTAPISQSKWSAPNVSKGASCAEYYTSQTLNSCAGLLLAVSLETGLIGLTSLLTAVLLQANPRSSPIQTASALPSNFDEVATSVLSILNNLARLDLFLIQNVLAMPDLRVEFFHLVSFLLSHCTCKWKSANDQVASLLLETLLLLGYFALLHPENQAVLRWGKTPTILHKICELPFAFFSDSQLTPVLNGTLLATCYGCEQNRDVVQQELSLKTLVSFLRSTIDGATASTATSLHKIGVDVTSERGIPMAQCECTERERVSGDGGASTPSSKSVAESNVLLTDKNGRDLDMGIGRRNLSTVSSSAKLLSEVASSPRKPLRNGSKPASQRADGDFSETMGRGPGQNRLSKGSIASPSVETFLFPFKKNKGVSVGVAGGFSRFSEVYTPLPSRLRVPAGISPVSAEDCKASSTVWKSKIFLLENRFPRCLWTHAEEFFSSEHL